MHSKWFSYTYAYIHSFSDSFLIKVFPEYWVEFPVLYSRSLLLIYVICSSIRIFTPSSWFIPTPHLSPLVTISLFSKSVSLSLFCKLVHLHQFWVSPIGGVIRCLSCSVWLASLGMIISGSIHVTANALFSSILWLSHVSLYICTT